MFPRCLVGRSGPHGNGPTCLLARRCGAVPVARPGVPCSGGTQAGERVARLGGPPSWLPTPSWRSPAAPATMASVGVLVGGLPGSAAGVARAVPTGAMYSTLLVLHVLCAVIGFGTLGITGVQARRARRGPSAPGAAGVRRYFRPGVNWSGRALYGVPVFGFCLVAASRGAFSADDGFVVVGLLLWAGAAVAAEAVVWPAERRIQGALASAWTDGPDRALERDCRLVVAGAAALAVVFVVATVLMVGKP